MNEYKVVYGKIRYAPPNSRSGERVTIFAGELVRMPAAIAKTYGSALELVKERVAAPKGADESKTSDESKGEGE